MKQQALDSSLTYGSGHFNDIPHAGLGLIILDAVADRLSYSRTEDGRNLLSILKCYADSSALASPSSSEAMQSSHISIDSEITAVSRVGDWFRQFGQQLMPKQVVSECELALTEALTNAVCHAHRYLPQSTPIEIETKVSDTCVEIQVSDYGQPFDLYGELHKRLAEHQA